MPLEIKIDLIPHGVEEARRTLDRVRITQVAKLDDDPDGERLYQVEHDGFIYQVKHRRSHGALPLCTKALVKLWLAASNDRDEALTRWLNGTWTAEQAAVIGIAHNMAKKARKPWWQRRKPHPMDFVPAARDVVTILMAQGWTPPGPAPDSGSNEETG